jgi:iron complex outermembrane receptor protein
MKALPIAASLLCGASVLAQTAQLDRVEVVGSRVPRIDAETALPVQIIRRDEIERSGAFSVEELLDRISANVGNTRDAVSIGDNRQPGFSGASLRGLGAGATLVLLNGRRLANYAFSGEIAPGVDLHAIPLAALERVEVLKDGASALYGSDAIGGVINFVTRSGYEGVEASVAGGWSEAGGAARRRGTLTFGIGNPASSASLLAVLDAQKSKALSTTDRGFSSTSYRPELGLDALNVRNSPANILLGFTPNGEPILVNPSAPNCAPATVFRSGGCWYDAAHAGFDTLPPAEQTNLLVRGTLPLGGAEGYAELSSAWFRTELRTTPTPVVPGTTTTAVRYLLPASSPYYPSGLGLSGDLNLRWRTLALGPRIELVDSTNRRMLVGLKGRSRGWDLDGALAINDSHARDRYASGFVDAVRLRDAIANGLVNPFGESGPEGQALLAGAEVRGVAREARGRTRSADLRASGDLLQLAAGPLQVALGVEARREDLRDDPAPFTLDTAGGTFKSPTQGARNVQAAFAELVAPLSTGVEVQLAARIDRYSDFGTAFNPKLALRVQPAREWLLRGSVGRGFRAPSLPELFNAQLSTTTTLGGTPDPLRCPVTALQSDCLIEPALVSGGNPQLRPERSRQATLGLEFQPDPRWVVGFDLWSIRLHDTIGTQSFDAVVADLVRFDGRNVVRGPVDPAFPALPGPIEQILLTNENLGTTRTSGADLTLAWRRAETALGRIGLRLDGTYVHDLTQSTEALGESFRVGRYGGVPRWRHTLTFTLDRGGLAATVSQNWQSGYFDANPLPDGSMRRVAPYQVWDAQLAWTLSRELRLTLGVKNLLDRAPPFTNQRDFFQSGYDPSYADPRGRFWTIMLTASWR